MIDMLLFCIKVQNNITIVNNVADRQEGYGNFRKLCLKISHVAGVKFVTGVVAENGNIYSRLYIL